LGARSDALLGALFFLFSTFLCCVLTFFFAVYGAHFQAGGRGGGGAFLETMVFRSAVGAQSIGVQKKENTRKVNIGVTVCS